jgi:uncharacterized protein YecE (DUF72 family)
MGTVRYGTSSWSEKSWVGPFYPKGTAPGDYLNYYATQFTTVEADVTYYRVPDRRLVTGWDDKTPDGFVLSAKFPRSVVHCGQGPMPDGDKLLVSEHVAQDTNDFLEGMAYLGPKCGPLVLQFPYFNKRVFKGPREFADRLVPYLDALPKAFRYAVEIRNKFWLKPWLLDLLRERNIALVLLDLAYMPHPDALTDLNLITTDFTFVRLIGDRKAVDKRTDTFDKIVLDQSGRISRWAKLLQTFMSEVPVAYVYANNHYAGHGPATIRQLVDLLPAEMTSHD